MNNRCAWVGNDPLYISYHDKEWGVPVHDDSRLFELIVLDGFQAGLSWMTVLRKRENFRRAFSGFNPKKVALFDGRKRTQLLQNTGIIRNKLKILAAIHNAKIFLEVKKEYGTFDKYIWQFVTHPIINAWRNGEKIPAYSKESDSMSKDMKKRGFKFCGTTICYAFMQAAGMVNDHTLDCFRYAEIKY